MSGLSSSKVAQATFELENDIATLQSSDGIFRYDSSEHKALQTAKPWQKDPHYFKNVKISALALLKMVMHARSGGNLEVMGLMTGKVDGQTMIVLDSFALPVEGTETRVNAHAQANEYMVDFFLESNTVGRMENAIGWYHSHPGYGCWLSGIDCSTQLSNQMYQEPFVAVVIDPVRTISAGKVNLGAFRTYPKGYRPPDAEQSDYQSIPLEKIEDFGVHARQYYALEVNYFKSSVDARVLDVLWNKYWLSTLAASPLLTNAGYMTEQMADISRKVHEASLQLTRVPSTAQAEHDNKLSKASYDSSKLSSEALHSLMAQAIKECLFNFTDASAPTDAQADAAAITS